jgi:hypothetical protein
MSPANRLAALAAASARFADFAESLATTLTRYFSVTNILSSPRGACSRVQLIFVS